MALRRDSCMLPHAMEAAQEGQYSARACMQRTSRIPDSWSCPSSSLSRSGSAMRRLGCLRGVPVSFSSCSSCSSASPYNRPSSSCGEGSSESNSPDRPMHRPASVSLVSPRALCSGCTHLYLQAVQDGGARVAHARPLPLASCSQKSWRSQPQGNGVSRSLHHFNSLSNETNPLVLMRLWS